jgi:hypothetical protein
MYTMPVMTKKEEVQTSVRMSKDLLKRAKQYALDHDTSLTVIFVEALEQYLARKGK